MSCAPVARSAAPQTCERKSKEILAAGAERLSASDKLTGIDSEIAASIDHTLLRPEATAAEVRKLCQEARKYNFASVCVNPYWVALVAGELAGSPVKVCTVVGFPLGANTTAIKVAETEGAIRVGAQEIDMVINVGELRGGNYDVVREDIRAVVQTAHKGGAIVKVILETALLDDNQKVIASTLAKDRRRGIRENIHRLWPRRRNRARCRADAPGGRRRNGRQGVGRHSHAGRSEEHGRGRGDAHRRQRQRENRRGHGALRSAWPHHKIIRRFASEQSCSISCWKCLASPPNARS